jgi:hypothetical protein
MPEEETTTKPTWSVYRKSRVADKMIYYRVEDVKASTAGDACRWICATQWISLDGLEAFPQGEHSDTFSREQ